MILGISWPKITSSGIIVWGRFRGYVRRSTNFGLFRKASWRLSGALLEGVLALSGLSWEAWCSKIPSTTNIKRAFSKTFHFAILPLLERFRELAWEILHCLGSKNGADNSCRNQKDRPFVGPFFELASGGLRPREQLMIG